MPIRTFALATLVIAATIGVGVVAGLGIARFTSADGDTDNVVTAAADDGDVTSQPTSTPVDDEPARDVGRPPTTTSAAPTTVAAPPPVATDVRTVDWESLTYVVEEDGGDVEVTPTTDEESEMGWAMGGQTFGDLDGDGSEDALVEIYNLGPSVRPAAAFVVLASDADAKGLATRRVQYPVFPSGNIQEVTIDGRRLSLRAEAHGLGGSNGSPPNAVTATYELRDGALIETSRTSTPKPDSIQGRFDAMVEAYLNKDRAGVAVMLGDQVERLGDVESWATELNDPSCDEGVDPLDVVCHLAPEGGMQVMITIEKFGGEVTDVFVGGGM